MQLLIPFLTNHIHGIDKECVTRGKRAVSYQRSARISSILPHAYTSLLVISYLYIKVTTVTT
jgi:hypothetical protein